MVQNCWEFHNCEKDKSQNGHELCPCSLSVEFDGFNRGTNGGRYCWRVNSTLCDPFVGRPVPNWADKMKDCIICEFFNKVRSEEGEDFRM
jgi:hypothetical protein